MSKQEAKYSLRGRHNIIKLLGCTAEPLRTSQEIIVRCSRVVTANSLTLNVNKTQEIVITARQPREHGTLSLLAFILDDAVSWKSDVSH